MLAIWLKEFSIILQYLESTWRHYSLSLTAYNSRPLRRSMTPTVFPTSLLKCHFSTVTKPKSWHEIIIMLLSFLAIKQLKIV